MFRRIASKVIHSKLFSPGLKKYAFYGFFTSFSIFNVCILHDFKYLVNRCVAQTIYRIYLVLQISQN